MQLTQPKPRWRKVLTYCVILLVWYLGICAYLAHVYLHPKRDNAMMTPIWIKEVMIPSTKGPVPSWASPRLAAGKGEPIVFVMAHGYGGDRETWTDPMLELPKRGFECVAPSMPGQDASPDPTVGFGVKEATMVLDTVKWVRAQYKKPPKIILYGLSMGGAAVWLASEQDPTVDAVVSEGAYSRFDEAMYNWLDKKLPFSSITLRPMIWMAAAEAQLNPAKILPLSAAAKWTKPALVVQGDRDSLIPMHQAHELAEAAKCPLWIVHNAAHAECYSAEKDEFLKRLTDLAYKL